MSVIIRLQNLPWSANALDIRQFFKGLSIPEGGVHIVGGEMGDAFIAFSTDEDARQAMMKDRGKLNETQVRLLLSSRAEMQKVIEVARQHSLLALQKAGAIPITPITTASSATPLPTPQPPVITTNSLQNILGTQLGAAPSFQTYQQQAGITLIPALNTKADSAETKILSRRESNESSTRDRRRSSSRERRRSRSRDRDRSDRSSGRRRRERSRTRSRERDRKGGRQRNTRRSRSRDRSRDRSRERSRDQNRNNARTNRNSRDGDTTSNNRYGRDNASRSSAKHTDHKDSAGNNGKAPTLPSWNIPPINAYETNTSQNPGNVIAGQVQKSNPLNAFATTIELGMRSNVSNAYTTSTIKDVGSATTSNNAVVSNAAAIAKALPSFQNYSTSTTTTNNYSVNILPNPITGAAALSDTGKTAFALQNPYTAALRAATSNSNSQDSNSSSVLSTNMPQASVVFPGVVLEKKPSAPQQQLVQSTLAGSSPQNSISQQAQPQLELQQQTIAFANTNPYAQMYPNLFAQAAAAGTGIANPVRNSNQNQNTNFQEQKFNQRLASSNDFKGSQKNAYSNDAEVEDGRSTSIKISNMCNGTTYSDLRKFFAGLFIPHNGIKMINDRTGARTGVAYIQFSRSSCVARALIRNNTFLKSNRVMIGTVSDEEFQNSEDSFKPYRDRESYNRYDRNERNDPYGDGNNRGGYDNRHDYNKNSPSQGNDDNGGMERSSSKQQFEAETSQQPFSVLYIEDIPAMATELDIMKMFSVFTIFDILLTVSPGNRREFTAYVKFSREDEAKAALLEYSRHVIGHRKLRIRPAKVEEMEKAKEKLRLANEQLKKEEQALAEAEKEAIENNINDDYDNMDDDNNGEDNLTIAENETSLESDNNIKSSNVQGQPNIPSIFDLQAVKEAPSDPRLRRKGNNNRFADTNNCDRQNRFADSKNDNSISTSSNKNEFPDDGDMDGDNASDMSSSQNMRQQQFNGPNLNSPFNAPAFSQINSMENNFVILKNCDYNTRINDIAQLLLSANLDLKHIEPLLNERKMPSGEFIVEFTNSDDALASFNRFNNTDFRNRNLRVRDITPQEIADRIGKPFMNYFPGGCGRNGPPHPMPMRGNFDFSGRSRGGNVGQQRMPNFRMNDGHMGGGDRNMGSRFGNNMNNRGGVDSGNDRTGNFNQFMRGGGGRSGGGFNRNYNAPDEYVNDEVEPQNVDDNENNISRSDNEDDIVSISSNGATSVDASVGIPEKFSRPGCVLAMENVPFKADLNDIIEFFKDFDVVPDDIIRRFNDDGSATGDARVAFSSPAQARAAYDAKRQKSIFNRSIYLSPL